MKGMVEIDGGYGEGGGQIIRSALALSCITQKPIHISKIRANRRIPGLRPQHLSVVNILQKITDAKVIGAKIGSSDMVFIPNKICSGIDLTEDIGTAGSIPLILQAIIPVVAIFKKDGMVAITGGTDVQWSPTMDYIDCVVNEAYARMNMQFLVDIQRRGYYPKGRGKVILKSTGSSSKSIEKVSFLGGESSTTITGTIRGTFSRIDERLVYAQAAMVKEMLASKGIDVNDIQIEKKDTVDSGASLLVWGAGTSFVAGATLLYNKKSGRWHPNTNDSINRFTSGAFAGVDENLADMLVLPASVGNGRTEFRVGRITKHLETNLYVASKITNCRYGAGTESKEGTIRYRIIVEGTGITNV